MTQGQAATAAQQPAEQAAQQLATSQSSRHRAFGAAGASSDSSTAASKHATKQSTTLVPSRTIRNLHGIIEILREQVLSRRKTDPTAFSAESTAATAATQPAAATAAYGDVPSVQVRTQTQK